MLSHSRKVVFISNESRCVAMNNQKADVLVHWDYHVVLLFKDIEWKVVDLDTLLPQPCLIEEYLSESFMPTAPPIFRVVDADDFICTFASDRRHMIDDNSMYFEPPPPWKKIGSGFNLWDFVDLSNHDHGQLYNLNEIHAEFVG